jgi:hypothetical protein
VWSCPRHTAGAAENVVAVHRRTQTSQQISLNDADDSIKGITVTHQDAEPAESHAATHLPVRRGFVEYPRNSREDSAGVCFILKEMDMTGAKEEVASSAPQGFRRAMPALTLVALSPLVAEVLPGATRFSVLFVLPVEMCVWGGGALLIRYVVRRWRLGWLNMLLLALALAVAEECLIQQTSLAPMFLQLKGQEYARAFGVNYVYLLWALVYEAVFVVIVPVHLVELIFPDRRDDLWINRAGVIATTSLFLIGCYFAWFSWTQYARPYGFHVPIYNPPLGAMAIAAAVIGVLTFLAVGPYRYSLARGSSPLEPPPPWLLGLAGGLWAVVWYGLVLLGFGIAPWFPPALAVGGGLILATLIVLLLPRWAADSGWNVSHEFSVIFGTMLGSMLVGFIGFIGAWPPDLYFKACVDLIALILMIVLGRRLQRRSHQFRLSSA